MHTEHLQNVSVGSVIGGWLVAIAVTSLMVFVFEASGFGTQGGTANSLATLVAGSVGFGAGGFFTGFRTRRAPVLHGIAIGLTSIVVWVAVNLVATIMGFPYDPGLGAALAIGVLLAMISAAAIGALIGYNLVLRGKPGLSEDYPGDGAA
jgi:hypothetical protein